MITMHILVGVAVLPFLVLLAFLWLSALPIGRVLIFPVFWVLCGGATFLFAVASGWSNQGTGPGLFGIVVGGLLAWYFASVPLWIERTKQKDRQRRVAEAAMRSATGHSATPRAPFDRPAAPPLALAAPRSAPAD